MSKSDEILIGSSDAKTFAHGERKKLILASQSPRRREILENLGVKFEVVVADTDESSDERDPRRLVRTLSQRKALAVRDALLAEGRDLSDTVILASDTVVSVDGEILGKPRDAEDAKRMLRLLSGRRHEVISGIALVCGEVQDAAYEVTEVEFDEMDEETVEYYVRVARPFDKAGAYAIQGLASAWIRGIHGDYFNVVGLPVHRLNCLYRSLFDEKIF
ncbi:MAG: septum formation protein Maf [Ruminococcaceae bacterium]|nr:septum formation protein Maf [Oscillospiraceae bacterium]